MEWNPYGTIFFKNLFQLLGFVEFLVFTTGIRSCLLGGSTCILKRKQLKVFISIKCNIIFQSVEPISNNERSGLHTVMFRMLWEDSNTLLLFHIRIADACGRAHASSLFPTIHIKGMHWACCKFSHNARFIIKKSCYSPSLPFDPDVCQGTGTQLLERWDWGAKEIFAYIHCSALYSEFL